MASNEVRIKVTANTGAANKQLSKLSSNTGRLKTNLGSAVKSFALMGTAVAAAGVGIGVATKKIFNFASNLELAEKKINIVFGDQASQVWDWADKTSARMGLTSGEAAELASKMGDLLIPMKFSREEAAKMSTDVVSLAGALSEWSGGTRSAAEVSDVLAKAMLGERVAIKALGISITEADIKQKILGMSTEKLSTLTLEQQKAIATRDLILEKSVDAQNAYAENTDGLSVAQAELSSSLGTLKETVAIALTPALHDLAETIRSEVVPFITEQFIPAIQENLPGAIETAKEVFGTLTSVIKLLLPVMGMVHDHAMRIINAIGFVAEKVNAVTGFFKKQREENSKVVDVYLQTEEQLEKTFAAYEKLGGAISEETKRSLENTAQLNTEEEILKEVTKFKGMATEQTKKSVQAMTEATGKTADLNKETKKLNDTLTATSLAQGLIAQGFFDFDIATQEQVLQQVADKLFEAQRAGSQVEQLARSITAMLPGNRFNRKDATEDASPGFEGVIPDLAKAESMFEGVNPINFKGAFEGPNKQFAFNVTPGLGVVNDIGQGGIGGTAKNFNNAFISVMGTMTEEQRQNTAVLTEVATTLFAQGQQQGFFSDPSKNVHLATRDAAGARTFIEINAHVEGGIMPDPVQLGKEFINAVIQTPEFKAGALERT